MRSVARERRGWWATAVTAVATATLATACLPTAPPSGPPPTGAPPTTAPSSTPPVVLPTQTPPPVGSAPTPGADAPSTQPAAVVDPATGAPRLVLANYMVCCYDTSLDEVQQTQLAASAGVDGFILDTFGYLEPGEEIIGGYAAQISKMYEAARQVSPDFRLVIAPDVPPPDQADNIVELVERFSDHPNQLRFQGRPVLSAWGGEEVDWAGQVLAPLRERTGEDFFFMPSFHVPEQESRINPQAADYEELYETTPHLDGELGALSSVAVSQDRGAASGVQLLHGSNVRSESSNEIRHDALGGEWVQQNWREVIELGPSMVDLFTWNDFTENTYFGPSGSDPDAADRPHLGYLKLSAYYADWYRTGQQPRVEQDQLFYFHRSHSKHAVATNDALGKPGWWDQRAEDLLSVTALLTSPGRVTLTTGGTSRSFDLPAGISDVTVPFEEGAQSVRLERDGVPVTEGTSSVPVSNAIEQYDFSVTSGCAPECFPAFPDAG